MIGSNFHEVVQVSVPPDLPNEYASTNLGCGTDDEAIARLRWPLVTIDFEASSLEVGSFPIEVGVCRWIQPNQPLETWSALLKPEAAWLQRGS